MVGCARTPAILSCLEFSPANFSTRAQRIGCGNTLELGTCLPAKYTTTEGKLKLVHIKFKKVPLRLTSLENLPLFQLGTQTKLQFRAHVHDFHSRHYQEFTAQHLPRLVIVGQFADDAAILAFLIPTEAAEGNCFGA